MTSNNDVTVKEQGMKKKDTISAEKLAKILKYTFAIIGLVLIIVTPFLYLNTNQFIEKSAVALGTVIDLEAISSSRGGTVYHPVIEFEMSDNRTSQFRSNQGSNPSMYDIGEKVEVLYDPSSPNDVRIKSFMSLWFPVILTGTLGIVFFLFGIAINYYFRPSKYVTNNSTS